MKLTAELNKSIEEIEHWLEVADSELLGITLTEEQRLQVNTTFKTLNFVKKVHLNIESEMEE